VSAITLVVFIAQATDARRITACALQATSRVRRFRRELLDSSRFPDL